MRIGTIGSGFIVRYLLENIAKVEGIRCDAVYSRSAEKGAALAAEFGIGRVYTDLEAMCNDPQLDMIYVASPNSLHYAHTKLALSCGKHVLCEKPFTPTAAEARELIALAKQKQLLLFEAMTIAFHPHYPWIREQLPQLGKLQMISATFCQYSSRYDRLLRGETPNVFSPAFAGGTLMDINMYNVWFIAGLLGRPDAVEYFAGKHENGIDMHGVLLLRYGNVICQCTGAKDTWCEDGVQIMGDRGYMHITPTSSNCQDVRLVRRDCEAVTLHLPENQWSYEVQKLAALQDSEEAYRVCYENLETTLIVTEILEQARQKAGIEFE